MKYIWANPYIDPFKKSLDKPRGADLFLISRKDWRNTAAMALVCLFSAFPASAQRTVPGGRHLQIGASVGGGIGLELGNLSVRTVYTRALVLLADLEPLFTNTDRQIRVAVLLGAAIRIFGFERLIGNAAYRGFDIDVGVRAGPAIAFSKDESEGEANRRFELVMDPFVRVYWASKHSVSWYFELGSTRPAFRVGIWIPY